jgi:ParB-like chromosome segregation protein Spo0J
MYAIYDHDDGADRAELAPANEESLVPIGAVRVGPSPRDGINVRQVAALVELDGEWEPILVRRSTMEIVDGRHRLSAAQRLGHSVVRIAYFDGTEAEARVEAVRLNVRHGLPLTLRERTTAARQLLTLCADWSDRQLGATCGLSPRTIARLRRPVDVETEGGSLAGPEKRVGKDGRRYPTDASKQRADIRRILEEDQHASLRAVAARTGASPETVRSVRLTLAAERKGHFEIPHIPVSTRPAAPTLATDSACSSTPEGLDFAQWFDDHALDERQLAVMASSVPISRAYGVIDEARRRMALWSTFADVLETRVYKKATSAAVPHAHRPVAAMP